MNHSILISGVSGSGKSASLRNLKNPKGVMYLNCESGKELPFKSKFKPLVITDPLQVPQAIAEAEIMPSIHTIIVDGTNFLMDMFESTYIIGSPNTMAGWQNYQQFFKNLMQQSVAKSTKSTIFIAHTLSVLNEQEMVMEVKVPIKGALKNSGIEAFFTTIVSTKVESIKTLSNYASNLLNITKEEEDLGMKYVFQTRLTKTSMHDRIRSPMGMFSPEETFCDNDAQLILDRLHNYYA